MNERIKELHQQAKDFINEVSDGDGVYQGKEYMQAVREKFAELIVRDCMSICKQHPSRIVSNNWNADAVAPDIVHRFEEHFGVEE